MIAGDYIDSLCETLGIRLYTSGEDYYLENKLAPDHCVKLTESACTAIKDIAITIYDKILTKRIEPLPIIPSGEALSEYIRRTKSACGVPLNFLSPNALQGYKTLQQKEIVSPPETSRLNKLYEVISNVFDDYAELVTLPEAYEDRIWLPLKTTLVAYKTTPYELSVVMQLYLHNPIEYNILGSVGAELFCKDE